MGDTPWWKNLPTYSDSDNDYGEKFGENYTVYTSSSSSSLDLTNTISNNGDGNEIINPAMIDWDTNTPMSLLNQQVMVVLVELLIILQVNM